MDQKLLLGLLIAGAVLYYASQGNQTDDTQTESGLDAAMTDLDQVQGMINGPTAVAGMSTSQAMLNMLMARESFSATPYMLAGESRYTWGYGHQGQSGEIVPAYITKADGATLFAYDV